MDDLPPAARRLIEKHLSPADAATLLREVRPAVALSHAPSATTASSHLGGRARLDPPTAWPEWHDAPLSLIAVVDLGEFRTMSAGTGLPTDGLLNLFYQVDVQPWGYDPADRGAWRVIPADPAIAEPRDSPTGATAFPEIGLGGRRVATYPDWQEHVVEALQVRDLDDYYDLTELLDADRAAGSRHQIGGWPELQQSPWQLKCQLASNGIYVGNPAGYEDPRVAALRAGAEEWLMLAQIDDDDDAGWMWGDAGTLYYAIRRQDLAAREFDRVWMVLQCG